MVLNFKKFFHSMCCGNAQSASQQEEECIICNYVPEDHTATTLSCGHRHHMPCVVEWWFRYPQHCLKCPICLQRSKENFMELRSDDKAPVSYVGRIELDGKEKRDIVMYWNQSRTEIPRMIVKLDDMEAKIMALLGCIALWKQNKVDIFKHIEIMDND